MAYLAANSFYASGLNHIRSNCTCLYVASGHDSEPTTLANVIAASCQLARHLMTAADFTIGVGDVSGRKITVAAQATISILNSGRATRICLTNGKELMYKTHCSTQSLTSGGTVTVPTWDIEVRAPAAA